MLSSTLKNSNLSVSNLLKEGCEKVISVSNSIKYSKPVELNGSTTDQYNEYVCGKSPTVNHCKNALSLLLKIGYLRVFLLGNSWKNVKNEFMWNTNPDLEALDRFDILQNTDFGKKNLKLH